MLAHALANHLNMPLLSLNVDGLDNYMFREARLSNSIVFLDECDDLLREDSHDSRTFLIEIEKSQCITIMATKIRTEASSWNWRLFTTACAGETWV